MSIVKGGPESRENKVQKKQAEGNDANNSFKANKQSSDIKAIALNQQTFSKLASQKQRIFFQ